MSMFRRIKPKTRKIRVFCYSEYTGKIVRDFRERQAGAEVEGRQEEWREELKRERQWQGRR
jgi:hypothetical protein